MQVYIMTRVVMSSCPTIMNLHLQPPREPVGWHTGDRHHTVCQQNNIIILFCPQRYPFSALVLCVVQEEPGGCHGQPYQGDATNDVQQAAAEEDGGQVGPHPAADRHVQFHRPHTYVLTRSLSPFLSLPHSLSLPLTLSLSLSLSLAPPPLSLTSWTGKMQCNDKTLSDGESVEVQMLISSGLFCTLCGSFTSSFRPHHRVFFLFFSLGVFIWITVERGCWFTLLLFSCIPRGIQFVIQWPCLSSLGVLLLLGHTVGKRLLVYVTVQLFSCIPRGIQFVTQWPCLSTLGVLLFSVR